MVVPEHPDIRPDWGKRMTRLVSAAGITWFAIGLVVAGYASAPTWAYHYQEIPADVQAMMSTGYLYAFELVILGLVVLAVGTILTLLVGRRQKALPWDP